MPLGVGNLQKGERYTKIWVKVSLNSSLCLLCLDMPIWTANMDYIFASIL